MACGSKLWHEIGCYLTGSPQSRLWQRAALRDLDAHLKADIGLADAAIGTARLWRQEPQGRHSANERMALVAVSRPSP